MLSGTRLPKQIEWKMIVSIGMPLTSIMSMHKTKSLCLAFNLGGTNVILLDSDRSLFYSRALDAPISGPKIFLAMLKSFIVTGKFFIMFCHRICLQFSAVRNPTI